MSVPADDRLAPRRTAPRVYYTRSVGWVWAVPIAAAAVVLFLLVRSLSHHGINATVTFDEASGMVATNTKVRYRGLEVGTVSSLVLSPDGKHVIAHLDLDKRMREYLRSGTKFYLEGAHPSLANLSSLTAIVSGPSIVLVPGKGAPQAHFVGIANSPPEALDVAVPYQVTFVGDVGGMQPGSAVTLLGFTVGVIRSVGLAIDPQTGRVATPVVLALDPTRFHIQSGRGGGSWTALMNATLDQLVRRGLRAHLTRSPPFVGPEEVVLDIVPDAAPATLRLDGSLPEIPAMEGNALANLPRKLDHLPIVQIADNVRAITDHLKELSSSPRLQDSIKQLDSMLAALDKTVRQAGPEIAPTLASVHQTVDSLRKTASAIDGMALATQKIVGGSPDSPNGNLEQSLREFTEASRSVRTFADYLDAHPEALIRGR
jgi:paraquat-inducible protein B